MLLGLAYWRAYEKTIRQIARNLKTCGGYFFTPASPKRRTVSEAAGVKIRKHGATGGTPMTRATATRHGLEVSRWQWMAGFWKGSAAASLRTARPATKISGPGGPDFGRRKPLIDDNAGASRSGDSSRYD
jgi:hypothetical protein